MLMQQRVCKCVCVRAEIANPRVQEPEYKNVLYFSLRFPWISRKKNKEKKEAKKNYCENLNMIFFYVVCYYVLLYL